MNVLDQSDELLRRCGELRARSVRACAAADKRMERSRQLIAAAARANAAVMHTDGLESAGPRGKAIAGDSPAGR
jgi:hypothetical protein